MVTGKPIAAPAPDDPERIHHARLLDATTRAAEIHPKMSRWPPFARQTVAVEAVDHLLVFDVAELSTEEKLDNAAWRVVEEIAKEKEKEFKGEQDTKEELWRRGTSNTARLEPIGEGESSEGLAIDPLVADELVAYGKAFKLRMRELRPRYFGLWEECSWDPTTVRDEHPKRAQRAIQALIEVQRLVAEERAKGRWTGLYRMVSRTLDPRVPAAPRSRTHRKARSTDTGILAGLLQRLFEAISRSEEAQRAELEARMSAREKIDPEIVRELIEFREAFKERMRISRPAEYGLWVSCHWTPALVRAKHTNGSKAAIQALVDVQRDEAQARLLAGRSKELYSAIIECLDPRGVRTPRTGDIQALLVSLLGSEPDPAEDDDEERADDPPELGRSISAGSDDPDA